MNKKNIVAGVVLMVAGTCWLLYHFSDQEVIKRKFTAIAIALCKEGDENPIMLALKMKPVQDFIAPACEITVPERNYQEVMDPGMVIRYLIMYRSRQTDLQVDLDEILVDVPGKGWAEVSASIHVTANHNRPDFFDEVHQVKFSLQKQKKKWLVRKATLPDALVRRY
jgi:hypothetical protein